MMITLSRLYPDGAVARAVVDELKAAGLPEDDIGVIASSGSAAQSLRMENADLENAGDKIDRDRDGADDRNEAAAGGAGIGAALGGAAGLLAGLGAFAVPGIGAIVAAGWVASTLAGAVAGGAAGGIVGALVEAGVSENDAGQYAKGVERGGTLVTIRVMAQDREVYEAILAAGKPRSGPVNYDPSGMPVEMRDLDGPQVKRP